MDEIPYSEIVPGNVLILTNRGQEFGGVVWRAPSTGELYAGDTVLTHRGEWDIRPEHILRVEIRPKRGA